MTHSNLHSPRYGCGVRGQHAPRDSRNLHIDLPQKVMHMPRTTVAADAVLLGCGFSRLQGQILRRRQHSER